MKYSIVLEKENYLIKNKQGKIISSCQTLTEAQAQAERFQAKNSGKNNKEQRGIYNVTYNAKRATRVKTDLEIIEDAVIKEVTMYVKGWHNEKRDKGIGAEHIKLHLEAGSKGEITLDELLNVGNRIREYISIFGEPYKEFEDKSGRVFEWEDKDGVRFRVAIDKVKEEGLIPPLSPFDNVIISFYSDRNAINKMLYKNPKVQDYYKQQQTQASGGTLGAQSQTKIRKCK